MRRTTFGHDLDHTQGLVGGHLDSAWITDHLQFDDQDDYSGFVGTPMPVVEQMRSLVALSVDTFILDCGGFPELTTLELLVNEALPMEQVWLAKTFVM